MKPRGAKKLKDVIDERTLIYLSRQLQNVHCKFDDQTFVSVASCDLQRKTFFERINQAAQSLRSSLPDDFEKAISILLAVAPPPLTTEGYGTDNYFVLILSRYIALYGLEYPNISLPALGRLTQSYTAEFDIRPFINFHPDKTFYFLEGLANSDCFHQRRLASEGCRPRLPMTSHLAFLKDNPEPCINILNILRTDPVRYVQRSVANNMADILKDNPNIAYKVLLEWASEKHPITNWIIKHALRKPLQEEDDFALEFVAQMQQRNRPTISNVADASTLV